MKNKINVSTLVICFLLIISVFFSVFSVSHSANHVCADDGCRICAMVQNLIDTFSAGLAVLSVCFFAFAFAGLFIRRCFDSENSEHQSNPILLKVKLSN